MERAKIRVERCINENHKLLKKNIEILIIRKSCKGNVIEEIEKHNINYETKRGSNRIAEMIREAARRSTYRKRLWICRVFDVLRTGHVEIDAAFAIHATIDGRVIVQLYGVRHLVALQQRKLNGFINVV